ncbi:diadenylate cyclase CdaA [Mollicutes bacterium LVI A0078]|nr:diadenylate cyclase CdaA [Mollicutes bacterium LVI A0075]WOO91505.1 diadenylate cyclase CdaA [Mollicutes bacterium LVI A0078]
MNYSLLTDVLNFLTSILDITLVAILIYIVLKILVQSERLLTLFNVFFAYILLYLLAVFLELKTLNTILNSIASWIVVIIFILFQTEIRDALERLGMKGSLFTSKAEESTEFYDELIDSLYTLGSTKTGALVTLERNMSLTQYTRNAIELDAVFTKQMLETIFNKETVIHDGAVIISDGRIKYASTYYPISLDLDIRKEYGTRHRAAMTISNETDSITLIVSEETGKVSFAYRGKLYSDVTRQFLKQFLIEKEV